MAFWNRKKEVRADVNPEKGEVVESDVLLKALLGTDTVTRDTAIQIPAIAACVSLIGSTIAGLPVRLYEKNDEGVKEITDDSRLFLLNAETGDTLTASQFWQAMIADYFLGKGGFAYLHMERGALKSIHYVEEQKVSYLKNTDPIFKDYDVLVQGVSYHPWDFLKILRHTKDGVSGTSICEENPMLITVAWKSLIYEKNLVSRGGNKRGFLQSDKTITKEAFEKLREGFRRLYSSNDENVVVLNNGVKFQEASNTSVEMQLNENKETNAREICELFGVPISMITGGASAEDKKVFIRTIAGILTDIECSLNRDLLLEDEKISRYFAFDTRELTRGDIKERYEAYKIGLDGHFLQVDEVRQLEDLEPVGFKWVTIGLNDVLLDLEKGTIYTPNTNALVSMDHAALPAGDVTGMAQAKTDLRADVKNELITGAPGSGKTTYVREHAAPGDTVVDLDALKAALFPVEPHDEIDTDEIELLQAMRDAIYAKINMRKTPGKAWIITTQADKKKLNILQDLLHADLHVMDTPVDEIKDRIMKDETRPDKDLFLDLVDKWFRKWGENDNES